MGLVVLTQIGDSLCRHLRLALSPKTQTPRPAKPRMERHHICYLPLNRESGPQPRDRRISAATLSPLSPLCIGGQSLSAYPGSPCSTTPRCLRLSSMDEGNLAPLAKHRRRIT